MAQTTEQTPLLSSTTAAPIAGAHYATARRFVLYQLVSLLSTVDGLCGTFALQRFNAKQVLAATYGATIDFHQGWLAGALLTGGGALAGLSCGIVFIVMMLHPSHHETRSTVVMKELGFTVVLLALLAACIFATVIFATGHATLYTPGLSKAIRHELLGELGSLRYKDSVPALLFIIIGWVMWLFLGASLLLVSMTGRHVLKNGPVLDAPKNLPERLAHRYLGPILVKVGLVTSL
ncbi:hypothetical protein BCR35DRAFT_304690 [Leucosporidium creatinivorum]|uniref:Uncharacterized protein n=1 Tax=Leucosporidium creatinivorum TaxID=106004 RepID=A0A1Y2F5X6_9BASI|nr:hypothetical protein BCR35DRAFT_304690 [Leucosporidium creatinivorum]